ncbi:MAG: phosphotransferase system enzyme I (PtsI) [Planctomycetota bacterium]|jgi:phosphotransferase system enzyme I (PtsI)
MGAVHVVLARPENVPVWSLSQAAIAPELQRLAEALREADADLELRQTQMRAEAGEKEAEIFAVHRTVLQDPAALKEVEANIVDERINAERAVKLLIERFEKTMGRLEGNYNRSYASDFSDPWYAVLDALLRRDRQAIESSGEKVILAAGELTPQLVTFLERDRILGVIAEVGGRFSHGAVLGRSLGVPCVVGLPNLMARLEQGMLIAVDGGQGTVQLRPEKQDIDDFLDRRVKVEARRAALNEYAAQPAVTSDGVSIDVRVNIESIRDLDTFDLSHTDGVGLLRTEFLYLERSQFPSEEEQFRLYRRILERMDGKPVLIRTLDIGGDKPLPYFKTPDETNPALGWRGIRISLEWRDLMQVQLRAMLRASVHGNLRILLPMVTSLEEVQLTHEIFNSVRSLLIEQGYEVAAHIPVGIMIEVPSALLMFDKLIEHIDFAAVGTNDLVQYLLAVDRDNSLVSRLYDPQHPAVIKALHEVAQISRRAGKSCSVCGELAGDPASAVLLLGLGYDSVSISSQFLPDVKFAIRMMAAERAKAYAEQALQASTGDGVREVLNSIRNDLYDQPLSEEVSSGK